MSWDSFFTDADKLRAKEGELFSNFTDEYLQKLKAEQAKTDMKWDIVEVLGVQADDPVFNNFVESNGDYLKEMLALRQLYWFFVQKTMGEDSVAQIKANIYNKLYLEKKSRLSSLITNNKIPSVTSLLILR